MGIFTSFADLFSGEKIYSSPAINTSGAVFQVFAKRRGERSYLVFKQRSGTQWNYATFEPSEALELSSALGKAIAALGQGHGSAAAKGRKQ